MDWLYVRAKADGKEMWLGAEWALLVFPVIAGATVVKKYRMKPIDSVLLALGTTVFFGAACVVWVLYIGVAFHFWIGGTL